MIKLQKDMDGIVDVKGTFATVNLGSREKGNMYARMSETIKGHS